MPPEKSNDAFNDIGLHEAGNGSRSALPYLATAGDLREVVQFLKRRPDGVTLAEAMDALREKTI